MQLPFGEYIVQLFTTVTLHIGAYTNWLKIRRQNLSMAFSSWKCFILTTFWHESAIITVDDIWSILVNSSKKNTENIASVTLFDKICIDTLWSWDEVRSTRRYIRLYLRTWFNAGVMANRKYQEVCRRINLPYAYCALHYQLLIDRVDIYALISEYRSYQLLVPIIKLSVDNNWGVLCLIRFLYIDASWFYKNIKYTDTLLNSRFQEPWKRIFVCL